jgi:dihydroorotate dehydrogenase
MYALLRPALFALDAETAHHATLNALKTAHCLGTLPLLVTPPAADPTGDGAEFPESDWAGGGAG